jgi:predicted transcriptional regulator
MCKPARLFEKQCLALIFAVLLPTLILGQSQTADQLPKIMGESLTGHQVVLPDDALGKVTVLIFGFSKNSKNANNAWARKISADFSGQTSMAVYQLPVIESAPRFIRGMIISSMRKDVPENMRDRFVPLVKDEGTLKTFVNYKEPDDAYVVVLDRSGKVMKQAHGQLSDATYSEIRQKIEALLK